MWVMCVVCWRLWCLWIRLLGWLCKVLWVKMVYFILSKLLCMVCRWWVVWCWIKVECNILVCLCLILLLKLSKVFRLMLLLFMCYLKWCVMLFWRCWMWNWILLCVLLKGFCSRIWWGWKLYCCCRVRCVWLVLIVWGLLSLVSVRLVLCWGIFIS